MAIPDRYIDYFKKHGLKRRRFRANQRQHFKYVTKEPKGWPLTRPATNYEWSHVLRVMIVRRVPKKKGIQRDKLITHVWNDLRVSSDAGRLYVEPSFTEMRAVHMELGRLINKYKILENREHAVDPDIGSEAPMIYRTQHTEGWLSRVSRVVQAVVDFLPVTDLLDLMVQAMDDDEEEEEPTDPPSDPAPYGP